MCIGVEANNASLVPITTCRPFITIVYYTHTHTNTHTHTHTRTHTHTTLNSTFSFSTLQGWSRIFTQQKFPEYSFPVKIMFPKPQ